MPDYGDIISSAAAIAAEMAKRRAQGRVEEAGVNQNQSLAEANLFRTRMDAALKGPVQSAQATAIGDTLANVKPFAWTGQTTMAGNIPVPQATGGLTPANYGPLTRQAGADLASQSAGRVKSAAFGLPDVPTLQGVPQAGTLDSILNAAGGIGAIGGIPGVAAGGGNAIGAGIDAINKYLHRNDNPFGGTTTVQTGLNAYDPFSSNPETGMPYGPQGLPSDPSGGRGYGPGMSGYVPPDTGAVDPSLATGYDPLAEYEEWLRRQGQDVGGGSDNPMPDGSGWGGE